MAKDNSDQFLFNSTRPKPLTRDWFRYSPWIIAIVSLFLASAVIYWLVLQFLKEAPAPVVTQPSVVVSSTLGTLNDKLGQTVAKPQTAPSKNEAIAFGDSYQALALDNEVKAQAVKLPLNIKEDTANYYYLNREITLSAKQLGDINQNGFVVIDNPYAKEANDFYAMYKSLNNKNLPFIVTSDFMIYYYQNTLKSIFKQLETESFYQEAWDFNKAMYEIANKRYVTRYSKLGLVNDPVLEAMRLETAYFAVALELLKVKPAQTMSTAKDSVQIKEWLKTKFTSQEADRYSFTTPSYLKLDVDKELTYIREAKSNSKGQISPVMLYARDYKYFEIPDEYANNPRLSNFYLNLKWLTNVFPLYYKSDQCPDCLLDKSDWLVNQAAAHLIARDMYLKQDIKNQWAKIYKIISYFSGLRSELTYLDYQQAFSSQFGATTPQSTTGQSGLSIEQLFDNSNTERDRLVERLQQEILSYKFDQAKGAYDRESSTDRKNIGFRLAQEYYWPTEYIYDQLTYDKVGNYTGVVKKIDGDDDRTACAVDASKAVRCRGIALDVINPIFNENITNDYFVRNSLYQSYFNQAPLLRRHFDNFDNRAWHNNLFWSNLHAIRQFLNNRKIDRYNYTQTDAWTEVVLNTAVSAMVSAELPYDRWRYFYQQDKGIASQDIVKYNYIEPNLALVNELLANTKMLYDSLIKLELVTDNHQEFAEIVADLETIKKLILKERRGEDSDYTDWSFINSLVNKYYVSEAGRKTLLLSFDNQTSKNRVYKMEQSISGVKLLLTVQYHQGRNLIVAGPVFNYNERGR